MKRINIPEDYRKRLEAEFIQMAVPAIGLRTFSARDLEFNGLELDEDEPQYWPPSWLEEVEEENICKTCRWMGKNFCGKNGKSTNYSHGECDDWEVREKPLQETLEQQEEALERQRTKLAKSNRYTNEQWANTPEEGE